MMLTLLSQVENGHPSTGIPRPIPPASPPASPSPALRPRPLAPPVCPRSPALPGERVAALGFGSSACPLSDAWCTLRARCDCTVRPGIRQGHPLPTHTQRGRELCLGWRGDGATLSHPAPASRALLLQPSALSPEEESCPVGTGSVPAGRGGASSPFFPGAGRVLPAAGPEPAAASQEPLAQKQRRGFSRDFLRGDFLCFAKPCPRSKAFPSPSLPQEQAACPVRDGVFMLTRVHAWGWGCARRQWERAQLCPPPCQGSPIPAPQQRGRPVPLGLWPRSL